MNNVMLFVLFFILNAKPFSAFCYGGWSAPSAIGIAGLGGGFEIGLEVGFYLTPDSLKEQQATLYFTLLLLHMLHVVMIVTIVIYNLCIITM